MDSGIHACDNTTVGELRSAFMYDPKCSTTFPWCTINAPAAFAWCTINAPAVFAWCTNQFVHKVEFSHIEWNGVHTLWIRYGHEPGSANRTHEVGHTYSSGVSRNALRTLSPLEQNPLRQAWRINSIAVTTTLATTATVMVVIVVVVVAPAVVAMAVVNQKEE